MNIKSEESDARARPRLSRFARRLLSEWKRLSLPVADGGIVAAVSGGADSTALLLALDELLRASRLELKVCVAHLDHGLRGRAGAADARWVEELAASLKFEIESGRVDAKGLAARAKDNLEQAARRARYEFLAEVAATRGAFAVLTAHTMEDQAETVLLRLLRGSGVEGLGGIAPVRPIVEESDIQLVRPLLGWARRSGTESYCRARAVEFRADAMNLDARFARVRVRRELLPLMLTFNARVVEALARTSELLRADSVALRALATALLASATETGAADETSDAPPVRVDILASAPEAVRRRALRLWIARGRGDGTRRLEFVHLLAVEKLLSGGRGGRIAELPGGSFVKRGRGYLLFHRKKVEKGAAAV